MYGMLDIDFGSICQFIYHPFVYIEICIILLTEVGRGAAIMCYLVVSGFKFSEPIEKVFQG